MTTYFVVQAFSAGKRGALLADVPIQARDRDHAVRVAERLAATKAGVVAFSRAGDPSTGEFEEALIHYGFGRVPPVDGEEIDFNDFEKERDCA